MPDDTIAAAIASTVAGRTEYLLAPIPLASAEIRSGNLVPLGVSSANRSPLLPDVPTLAEAGVVGFDYSIWYGLWAPARTPAPLVEKLAADIARVLASPDLLERLTSRGSRTMNMAQPEFARFVRAERESAASIIEIAGIRRQ